MKRKTRVVQESSIVEKSDKTSEVIMEHRILQLDTQNNMKGFLIGIRDSVVRSAREVSDRM